MSRTVHVHLDIAGALKSMSNREFTGMFDHDDGRRMTAEEAKANLIDILASGVKVLPIGEPCEGFSYTTGCPGHETEVTP